MPWSKKNEKAFAIYWIRLQEHTDMFSQGYIGVTGQGVGERYRQHLKNALTNDRKRSSPILSNAIRKYGDNNLLVTAVAIGNIDYIYDLEQKLRPTDKIGWNVVSGGYKSPSHSEEVRRKIGESNRGKVRSAETRARLSAAHLGKRLTKETKQKMSVARKGIPLGKSKVLPWKHNRMSQNAREFWKSADKLYSIWLLNDKPKSSTLATLYGVDISTMGTPKTFRTLYKLFKEFDWNPLDDVDWIEWRTNVE